MTMTLFATHETELLLDWKAAIAEAPIWDAARGSFWCVDNVVGDVIEIGVDGKVRQTIRRDRPVAAVLPRRAGGLLLAEGLAFTLLDADGGERVLATLDANPATTRINEAKCDPQGRVWAGTVAAALPVGGAALYRVDAAGRVDRMVDGLTIGNGMGWSPDGGIFYLADSPTARIDAFDFDDATGALGGRRTVVHFDVGEGWPDGLCVDAEGAIWVAVPLTSEVRRYSPEGGLLARMRIDAPFATSCAFGGEDHSALLVTSGSVPLPPQMIAAIGFPPPMAEAAVRAERAGGLFLGRPGVRGMPSAPFPG
ncbi:hypothetical protein GCM10007897_08170 [Sphingobium jiangsuense]|uniref:Sugar lactone lactonase YvrE n=1 Tax=Sphingobium jiangsuense TaxID=870476 RepID=A0A7W6BNB5_9SPHN|nr:SMP-30/gluconolactonase/LRE family protein [Sphingobium jiangsuense]MBB3926752.1 sugar lactone lactonase YvrE [Sphingobium jiangsuense]GLS99438.1 hypothetical protein GCM10007897_08170 [Sphingobium jiangsuense]